MARVQYGTIITEIKGKVQGQVFQGGNVGFVLRNKGYTKGISTEARVRANAAISANASEWRNLSNVERSAWGALAPDWLFYNKFGAAYQGSGFQIFNSYNGYLKAMNQAAVSTPGAVSSPTDPGSCFVEAYESDPIVFIRSTAGLSTERFSIFAAAPMSPGRNINNIRFQLLSYFQGNTALSTDITTIYKQKFGNISVGQRITLRAVFHKVSFPYPFYAQNVTTLVEL